MLMKLLRKWVVYLAGALVLLVIFAILVEHVRGKWALNTRLKELAAKGEILTIAELKPKRPPLDQNILTDLLVLTNQLKLINSNLNSASPLFCYTPKGRAVVTTKLNQWSLDGRITNDWTKVGEILEKGRDLFEAIQKPMAKPYFDTGFDYEKGFVDFPVLTLAQVRGFYQLLNMSGLHALHRGNRDAAHKDLVASVTFIARQTPEPLIICQLVRQVCAKMAFGTTWQAMQMDGWNDVQLASLQAAWQACDFVKDMATAVETERAMTLDFYTQVRNSKEKLVFVVRQREPMQEMMSEIYGTSPTRGVILYWLHLPVWRVAWAAQDELESLEQYQFTIERERLARSNGWAALSGKMDPSEPDMLLLGPDNKKLGFYDQLRYLFARWDSAGLNDALIRKTLDVQTQQQMVLAALGIERYRLRTGKLPSSLSALVPDYLKTIPHDFMDGKDLKYRLQPDTKSFVLYSVGHDGKDDGGDGTQSKEITGTRQLWDGRDAVWPAPATAEEAQAAIREGYSK